MVQTDMTKPDDRIERFYKLYTDEKKSLRQIVEIELSEGRSTTAQTVSNVLRKHPDFVARDLSEARYNIKASHKLPDKADEYLELYKMGLSAADIALWIDKPIETVEQVLSNHPDYSTFSR